MLAGILGDGGESGEQDGRPTDFVRLDEARPDGRQQIIAMFETELAEEADRFVSGRPGAPECGVVRGERMSSTVREQRMDGGEEDIWRRLAGQRFTSEFEQSGVVCDGVP